jgi:hypothetical protein
MKLFTFIFVFVFLSLFSGTSYSQEGYYGVGEETDFVQPQPAQGNSAGVDYNLEGVSYTEDSNKQYTISFDSEVGEVIINEVESTIQEIIPMNTGTEYIDFEEFNYNNENPESFLADFYYSMILEPRSYGYAWYINYTWTNFQERLLTLGNQGFRIENIDTYGKNVFDYGGTWTQDGQGWAWVLNYTVQNDFINVLNAWPVGTPRYRPIDFAMNIFSGTLYYGAVAISDNLGFAWLFNEGSTSNFLTWVNNQYNSSRRLVDIELYRDGAGNLMHAGISKDGGYAQQVSWDLNWTQFLNTNTNYINQGYRIVDFCKYEINGSGPYYAGLWNNDGVGYAYDLDDHNQTNFTNVIAGYINQGYKPIMIDMFDSDWIVAVEEEMQPIEFNLNQNYPNPFNPSTKIKYSIPQSSKVVIKVFDILGNEIETLVNEEKPAGTYEITWYADQLPSGVYFYKMQANDFINSKKMILIK